jgi:hypothetical protein
MSQNTCTQTSVFVKCDIHFYTQDGCQFLSIMLFSVWLWLTLPASLLSLLDSHIYKMSITNNEGSSGILLTGVWKLLVLLDGNLVCLDSVTSFHFQFMCDNSAVRNMTFTFPCGQVDTSVWNQHLLAGQKHLWNLMVRLCLLTKKPETLLTCGSSQMTGSLKDYEMHCS